jgi:hypothetical protein
MASNARGRGASGNYPPNPTQWGAERNGITFRNRFRLTGHEPLKPFLRTLPGATVLATREQLSEFVDDNSLKLLLGKHAHVWSGATIPCDDEFIVVINMTHAQTRQNATLMEEFFHIILKHRPSKISACPHTGIMRREYNRAMETEAYHSAAAALVPYSAMKRMVSDGASSAQIAAHFEVSPALVTFRMKTCRLYRRAS